MIIKNKKILFYIYLYTKKYYITKKINVNIFIYLSFFMFLTIIFEREYHINVD